MPGTCFGQPRPAGPPNAARARGFEAVSSGIRLPVTGRFDGTRGARAVLFVAICGLGISAFMTQLTLMRELLAVFSGNELVLGIVLGNWLLLTGLGAYLGRTAGRLRDPAGVLIAAQVAIAVLPVGQVFLLRALRNQVFLPGAAVGVTETVVSCLVLLAPYCLVAGYLLTLASLLLATGRGAASIGQVYFLDNVGDVLGGLLFSVLILFERLDHFSILYIPAALNLALAATVAVAFRRRLLLAAAVVSVLLVGLAWRYDLNRVSSQLLFPGQTIVYQGNSAYGSLLVTRAHGQYNFVGNGVVLFSTHNVGVVEETVHYAMAQRPLARRVLLISGGVSGTAREILRYPRAVVDYVELDPLILRVAARYLPESLADPRIRVFASDGRRFVRQSGERYDVVIVDVPDPSTSQINRFYTREFFAEVARRLVPDGVLCLSLGHYENYMSAELADLVAVTSATLRREFDNLLMLPASEIYFLASDGPLTADVAGRIERQGIRTELVNRHYLEATLSPDRLAAVARAARPDAPINRDFNPLLYYYHLRYWMSQFRTRLGLLEAALAGLLLICLLRARPVSFAIFTTGLAASALEVVLLVGFQILVGCVYYQVAIIVTMFMIGLGIGSWTMNRHLGRWGGRGLAGLEFGMAVYALIVPAVLLGLGRIGSGAIQPAAAQVVVPMLALLLAVMVGLEFPLAGKTAFRTVSETAAGLYTADYLGAALGALWVSTLLIPLLGVLPVCLLAAGLNLLSGGVVYWSSVRAGA